MSEEKKGIEDLSKCIELAVKNVSLGKEIAKDGVGWEDVKHAAQVFANVKELVEFVQSKPELAAEIKDIDPSEGFALVQKIYAAYNEVK